MRSHILSNFFIFALLFRIFWWSWCLRFWLGLLRLSRYRRWRSFGRLTFNFYSFCWIWFDFKNRLHIHYGRLLCLQSILAYIAPFWRWWLGLIILLIGRCLNHLRLLGLLLLWHTLNIFDTFSLLNIWVDVLVILRYFRLNLILLVLHYLRLRLSRGHLHFWRILLVWWTISVLLLLFRHLPLAFIWFLNAIFLHLLDKVHYVSRFLLILIFNLSLLLCIRITWLNR